MRRLTAIALLLAACNNPGAQAGATSGTAPATAKPTATATAKPSATHQYADEDVAVPADFEEEAEKSIPDDGDSYKDETSKIEAELGIESPDDKKPEKEPTR